MTATVPTRPAVMDCGLYIDGQPVAAVRGRTIESTDPASGALVARIAAADNDDVDRAVASAKRALATWGQVVPSRRGRILSAVAAGIRADSEQLARLETLENGKPASLARAEVEGAARYFEFYAGMADKFGGDTIPLGPEYLSYLRREPFGVIAEILPWNAPLNQAARGIAPALCTANTVVAKPSELTSLTCLKLAEIASAAGVPNGAFNVVTGTGLDAGQALVSHSDVSKVSFTGSVTTGRTISQVAAERLIPVSLELGGKSANIVFADADLDKVTPSAFEAFTRNAGQICSAGTRLLVAQEIHDDLVDRLVARAQQTTIGPGAQDPELGPLTSEAQLTIVNRYLRVAADEGARILPDYQDEDPRPGHFVRPRILVGVTNDMTVAREEIFGPVLSVIPFTSEDEAVQLANDSPFGLVAGVWTSDLSRAHRVAARLDAGQVFINEYFAGGEATPFGGYKQSGHGRLKGIEALHHYTQVKTVTVRL